MYKQYAPVVQIASQALTAAALTDTYTMTKDGFFHHAWLSASVGITETVTITVDSLDGSTYDVVLKSTDLGGASDFSYIPARPVFLRKGDAIKISCTNANVTGTVYSTMTLEEVRTHVAD